ncbi:MAG TPA: glycosyltransferase family 4 protein [Thermoanaerobaculia bacterium]|nr:glycosyltransferase family 4 protein [Thermoanaerobaculia bacterium]
MSRLRVAYVLNVFPKISEAFIADELAELARRGVEVRILSLRLPADEPRHDVIARARLLERTSYEEAPYREALRRFRPHLVHAHFAREATAKAREIAGELDCPFTFTAHGYDVYRRPPEDFAARAGAAAGVVTVSRANARHIERNFGVPAARLTVIPCGVDTERFRPAPGARPEPPRILCVARLVKVKNHELLLRACALLRDRGREFRCVLVGDGAERGELEARRAEFHLEDIVEMRGAAPREEVLERWREAAIGVLTSSSEGMPVALMEAAACGVPVVATAVGGLTELVEHGRTGLLVPAGDAPALAAALERLLTEPQTAREMGLAARRRAEELFSVRREVDALLALWDQVLDRRQTA